MGDVAIQQMSSSAVLLVGHGTRDVRGLAEFERLAESVAGHVNGKRVKRAYLELAGPTILEAIERLAAEGATSIRVVPLLLFAAGHAKRDLPAAVEAAARRHPGLKVEIAPAFGCDEEILALSERRFEEALAERSVVGRDRTMLLLVGRGTSDAEAIDEVRQFAALRREQSGVGRADVCFVAAARPSLVDGMGMAAQAGYPRVVVQPHLLFAGQVLDEIQAAVRSIERQTMGTEWILTRHLGPEEELVRAVVRRAN
jgi:sirohydrochlorin ferrochelatase